MNTFELVLNTDLVQKFYFAFGKNPKIEAKKELKHVKATIAELAAAST